MHSLSKEHTYSIAVPAGFLTHHVHEAFVEVTLSVHGPLKTNDWRHIVSAALVC